MLRHIYFAWLAFDLTYRRWKTKRDQSSVSGDLPNP